MTIINPRDAKPLHIRNAEQLLTAMRSSGLTPQEVAEALHTAIFLLAKGNNLSPEQTKAMFAQEVDLLASSGMVFASDLLKGSIQ